MVLYDEIILIMKCYIMKKKKKNPPNMCKSSALQSRNNKRIMMSKKIETKGKWNLKNPETTYSSINKHTQFDSHRTKIFTLRP